MKNKKTRKLNIKSNSGFTMTDLVTAIIIFLIFAGMMGGAFYQSYRLNAKAKVSDAALNYTISILEDVDKITYDEVQNGMESKYREKFSIPDGYKLSIDVSNYNEGNDKKDLIKMVKVTMEYEILGDTEKIYIEKMKVKEI